jgi:hypothetical protein
MALCAAAVGLGLAFPHQIGHQLALSFTREPTTFTQLYFTDPAALPASLGMSGRNAFSFTVVNNQGHDEAYSYAVTLMSSYGSSTVDNGVIYVSNKKSESRSVNISPTRRNQTIHFRTHSAR